MLKFARVCVPLSLDCNLHCKYCYRDKEKLDKIPDFSSDMIEYLGSLSPEWCECVCASGGEPLLHFSKVKELFSYVPKNVHKKIMSNCTLLTQEIVDYINDNEIELHFSHDGRKTKFLRGVDVLENKVLRNLIYQVKILHCFSVVTKYNTDIWENYFDTVKKLGRIDFYYDTNALFDVSPNQKELVEGFDYDEWFITWSQFKLSPFSKKLPWYDGKTLSDYKPYYGRGVGTNILPDGTLCGMIHVCSNYGTIHSSRKEYVTKAMETLLKYCKDTNCQYVDRCSSVLQHASEHTCRCRKMIMDRYTDEYVKETRAYLFANLPGILKKYGFDFAGTVIKEKYGCCN